MYQEAPPSSSTARSKTPQEHIDDLYGDRQTVPQETSTLAETPVETRATLLNEVNRLRKDAGLAYADINDFLRNHFGKQGASECTEPELQTVIGWITQRLEGETVAEGDERQEEMPL